MKLRILTCSLVLGALLLVPIGAIAADPAEADPFFVGAYLYEYRLAAAAEDAGTEYFQFLDHHLGVLHEHGVNAIYLGGTSRERFDETLRLAARHDMRLIPQLDFAYFQPDWSDEQIASYAKTAGEFIDRYRDEPRVIAWSVREEVPAGRAVERLATYYARIREHAPAARFNMIHNSIDAARTQPAPHAAVFGTDRYAFWFEVSGGGYLASPSFALDWTRREAARYYDEAARRDAAFMLVVTQGGLLMPAWANQIVRDPHGAGIPGDERERQQVRDRVVRFAEQGRMGWRKFDGPGGNGSGNGGAARYNFWKYYRLPPNCVRALAWTSVLEGAKLFFVWSYAPPTKAELALDVASTARAAAPEHEVHWFTLAGRPGMANPQLRELAAVAREIRAYGRLIPRMAKLADSPIACDQAGVHHRGFSLPDVSGRVVVIHNANVGRWPHGSRHFFAPDDDIRIDDAGNLVGYEPFTEPLEVRVTVKGEGGVFDVLTGAELPGDAGGGYRVRVAPGSGTLLFVGSRTEAETLRTLVRRNGE